MYTTCSKDAIPLVTSLGPDMVFDRNDKDFETNVRQEGKYVTAPHFFTIFK